jgi:hypothetical protein
VKSPKTKIFASILAVLVIASGAYFYRVRIETWLWHVHDGTATTVGGYIVPVPSNWYPQDEGAGTELLVRLDTDDNAPLKRIKAHSSMLIYVSPRVMKDQDLVFVLSREKEAMEKRGVLAAERTIDLNGESLLCLGDTTTLNSKGIFDLEPMAWTCRSPGGLEINMQATEPDLSRAWDIVSHIRRKS